MAIGRPAKPLNLTRQEMEKLSWRDARVGKSVPVTTAEMTVTPAGVLGTVAQMASRRALGSRRKCQACGKWFFAATNKKFVCDDTCRTAKYKQADPDGFKRKRVQSMRLRRTRRNRQ